MIDLEGNVVSEAAEEAEGKVKKVGLFDFTNDLTFDKQYLFSEETQKEFLPFMVNRALSQQPDLIMIANEMNKCTNLSKEMVHDFYFYLVKKQKRYGKWSKSTDQDKDILDLLMRKYDINRMRAMEYLKLMSDDDVTNLKAEFVTGGRK